MSSYLYFQPVFIGILTSEGSEPPTICSLRGYRALCSGQTYDIIQGSDRSCAEEYKVNRCILIARGCECKHCTQCAGICACTVN